MLFTNTITSKDYRSLRESIYRGGNYIDRYESQIKYKKQFLYTLVPALSKYKSPTDAVYDYIITKQGLQPYNPCLNLS